MLDCNGKFIRVVDCDDTGNTYKINDREFKVHVKVWCAVQRRTCTQKY